MVPINNSAILIELLTHNLAKCSCDINSLLAPAPSETRHCVRMWGRAERKGKGANREPCVLKHTGYKVVLWYCYYWEIEMDLSACTKVCECARALLAFLVCLAKHLAAFWEITRDFGAGGCRDSARARHHNSAKSACTRVAIALKLRLRHTHVRVSSLSN